MKRANSDSPPRAQEPIDAEVQTNYGNTTTENKIVKVGDKEISKPVIRRQLIKNGFTPTLKDKNVPIRELQGELLATRKRREGKLRPVTDLEGIKSVIEISPHSLMRWIGVDDELLATLTHGPKWKEYLETLPTDSNKLPCQRVLRAENDMVIDRVNPKSSLELVELLISKQQFGPACNYLLRCKRPQREGLQALFHAGIEHMALEENDREVFYKVVISAAKAALHEYDEHANNGSSFQLLFNACSHALQLRVLAALLPYPDVGPPLSLLLTDILFEFLDRGLKDTKTAGTPEFREWMDRALLKFFEAGKYTEFTSLFTKCPPTLQRKVIRNAPSSAWLFRHHLVNLASQDIVIEMLKEKIDYYYDEDDDDGSSFKRLFNACSPPLQLTALEALLAYEDLGPPPVSLLPTDILFEFLERGLNDPNTADDLMFGEWMIEALPKLLKEDKESEFRSLFTRCQPHLQQGVLAEVTKSAPLFVPYLLNLASHDLILEFLKQKTNEVSDVPQLYEMVTMLGLLSKKDGVNADTVATLASAMREAWIRLHRDERPTPSPYLAAKIESAFEIREKV